MNQQRVQTFPRHQPPRFELTSGAVCLDFVNTLDNRPSEPKEKLKRFYDLVHFGEDTGTISETVVSRLIETSLLYPDKTAEALESGVRMREAMYAVFWAIVNKKPAPAKELYILNGYIAGAAHHARLAEVPGGFEWRFEELPARFDAPLWPIARSAADLLASDELKYVRPCASKTCQWLFLDTSKNHRRRWCDMKVCGNRAKARRFYARAKRI